MNIDRLPHFTLLAGSIVAALATAATSQAATIHVDGVNCTLSDAITAANTDAVVGGSNCAAGSGDDDIILDNDIDLTGFGSDLPGVLSNIAFSGAHTISGDPLNAHRLFFVGDEKHAPTVSFSGLALANAIAQGGGSRGGSGAGAGLGGALFIYNGIVSVVGVTFSHNAAVGGSTSGTATFSSGGGGGGGMFGGGGGGAGGSGIGYTGGVGGSGGFGGGGGGGGTTFASEQGGGYGGDGGGSNFGYGGKGDANTATSGGFGGGGGGGGVSQPGAPVQSSQPGAYGGFGGGGGGGGGAGTSFNSNYAGAGAAGGFGGGGGAGGSSGTVAGSSAGVGGDGGFGGGGGAAGLASVSAAPGTGGFGGGDTFEGGGGGGAGFGGAIFIRSGSIDIQNSTFDTNSATAGAATVGLAGAGKGGAVFAMHITSNGNLNDQGMPTTLPVVTGCSNTFTGSSATNAGTTSRDNADAFGVDSVGLALVCNDRIFADGFGIP